MMQNNRNVVRAVVGVGALMVALVLVQHVAAASISARTTYLTFNRPMELPGVMLEPGTYIFELAEPMGSSGAVHVLKGDRRTPVYMGFTHLVERPSGLRLEGTVSLSEAASGVAPRITT